MQNMKDISDEKENYTLCSEDLLRVIHPHDINHLEEEEVELENKTKVIINNSD